MRRLGVLVCLFLTLPASQALAVANPNVPGSDWTQATIDSPNFGPAAALTPTITLHADILRPKNLAPTAKTPVILSIGPYFNHSGEVGPAGPVEDADYDPTGPVDHPSSRFDDFVNGAKLMDKGYTFVMVDLRGFGGSGGCLDWGGAGEQADVKAAVEWAATQQWSTGKVGLYGKSYDGVTGLMGVVNEPAGLKAVVSMEPVYDLYRYLYSEGVRYENSLATPNLYNAIAGTPGPLADSIDYNINAFNTPDCLITNFATQQDANHTSDFWKARTFIEKAKGKTTPLFLTQGFLENNTKPDGAFDFFNNLAGTHNRAWYGMWDHVRGNEKDADGRLVEGRAGFFDEVMRFYDRYLEDDPNANPDADPRIVVQTSDGTWRAEKAWPPTDSTLLTSKLKPGSHDGDGQNAGSQDGLGSFFTSGNGIWTFSPPLAHDAWYSGVPKVELETSILGANPHVAVATYDVDAMGKAILLSRNATLVGGDGKVAMDLYGNDWKIPAGHRLGVLVSDVHAEWWLPADPESIELISGKISLPFLKAARPDKIQGDPAVRLEEWLKDAPFTIDPATITAGTDQAFVLPPPLTTTAGPPAPTPTPTPAPGGADPTPTPTPAPAGTGATPTPTPAGATPTPPSGTGSPGTTPNNAALRVRLKRLGARKRLLVRGRAPKGAQITIGLRRNGRVVKTRVVVSTGRYRVGFKIRKKGRYSAVVVARTNGTTLKQISKVVRYRA